MALEAVLAAAQRPPSNEDSLTGASGNRRFQAKLRYLPVVIFVLALALLAGPVGRALQTPPAASTPRPLDRLEVVPSQVEGRQAQGRAQSVRLYVLDCGVLERGDPAGYGLTRAQVGSTDFSDPCYLVVHPRGTMLWEAGIIPDDQITPGGVRQPARRGVNTAAHTLRSQLKEIGHSPRTVTYLALSHGHADHVANANEYARSTWLVQRAERDFMFSAEQQNEPFFAHYRALKNSKTVLLDGDYDVFRDGTVVLTATPGHTPGHQSLFVRLARTGPIVLSGDLYHYPAERTLKTFRVEDNLEQTTASRAAIDTLLEKTGGQLWIQHDILANATLKKAPLYYD